MAERKKIRFDEGSHRYTDEDNFVYTPVTSLINKYAPQFDREYWSAKKAQELGLTQDQVKKSWDDITKFAQDKGNKVHKTLEDSINTANGRMKIEVGRFTPEAVDRGCTIIISNTNLEVLRATPLARQYPKIYKYLEKMILDGWSLLAEMRVYWFPYLVAGTIDAPLFKGRNFIIVDWKTNKDELKFKSGYYKKVNGIKTDQWVDKKEYFFSPLTGIEHCKGNVYTLQLTLYAHILELWGYRCVGLVLFHIRDNGEPREYAISYLDWAAKLMCEHHKANGNNMTRLLGNQVNAPPDNLGIT